MNQAGAGTPTRFGDVNTPSPCRLKASQQWSIVRTCPPGCTPGSSPWSTVTDNAPTGPVVVAAGDVTVVAAAVVGAVVVVRCWRLVLSTVIVIAVAAVLLGILQLWSISSS